MSSKIETAIVTIRSICDEYCENQMYVWPGFDPMDPAPDEFFRQQGIDFDGELFIRYPVKRTFKPIPMVRIENEERSLGVTLPMDYKLLLEQFGAFHLPGKANVCLESPVEALRMTRSCWCFKDKPLSVLAISSYNDASDGNAIGFVRQGDSFEPSIYEFNHELLYEGDAPSLWTRKVSSCLADFVLEYLGCTSDKPGNSPEPRSRAS